MKEEDIKKNRLRRTSAEGNTAQVKELSLKHFINGKKEV